MRILRTVAAVVAGIAIFSLSLAAAAGAGNVLLGTSDEWINRSPVTQSVWLLWNIASLIAAGYVAAASAPRAAVTHSVVMGAVQAAFTVAAMLTVSDDPTPSWLWLAGIVATIPAAWAGGRLRVRR